MQDSRLLKSIAEQLKSPLANIARTAELGRLTGTPSPADLAAISTQATAALTLVDSYLLGLELLRDQAALQLEPVSVSSTLVEVAHDLEGFAKQYNASIELHIAGRYEPVMAHQKGLKAAVLAVGFALLEGYPMEGQRLTLAVHRTPQGIATGIYGMYERLSTDDWRRALALYGQAQRPLLSLTGSGAGLFVADAIFRSMDTTLRVGRYLKKQGLATTLQQSQQLSFV